VGKDSASNFAGINKVRFFILVFLDILLNYKN